jgi:hypothetical protein
MKLQTGLRLPRSLAIAAGAVAAMACGAASAQTQFVGFTNGCFGLACLPEADQVARTDFLAGSGLTYANSTFDLFSSGGTPDTAGLGATGMLLPANNIDNLGSFTLTGTPFNYAGSSFTLRVSFTAPPGTAPDSALFTSTLIGSVTPTDNGGITVNFDNTARNFTFAGGTFTLEVNDVSLTPHTAEPTPVPATGFITITTAIPEPETYALFLAGLGAVGFMARRRKS